MNALALLVFLACVEVSGAARVKPVLTAAEQEHGAKGSVICPFVAEDYGFAWSHEASTCRKCWGVQGWELLGSKLFHFTECDAAHKDARACRPYVDIIGTQCACVPSVRGLPDKLQGEPLFAYRLDTPGLESDLQKCSSKSCFLKLGQDLERKIGYKEPKWNPQLFLAGKEMCDECVENPEQCNKMPDFGLHGFDFGDASLINRRFAPQSQNSQDEKDLALDVLEQEDEEEEVVNEPVLDQNFADTVKKDVANTVEQDVAVEEPVVVAGAGTAAVNGVYRPGVPQDGRQTFVQERDPSWRIVWSVDRWVIIYETTVYYSVEGNTPVTGAPWRVVFTQAAGPAPYVMTSTIWTIYQKRWAQQAPKPELKVKEVLVETPAVIEADQGLQAISKIALLRGALEFQEAKGELTPTSQEFIVGDLVKLINTIVQKSPASLFLVCPHVTTTAPSAKRVREGLIEGRIKTITGILAEKVHASNVRIFTAHPWYNTPTRVGTVIVKQFAADAPNAACDTSDMLRFRE